MRSRHIINITDVGHLTSDSDAGDDKMEKGGSVAGKTALGHRGFLHGGIRRDLSWLNVRDPAKWTVATDYRAADDRLREKHRRPPLLRAR